MALGFVFCVHQHFGFLTSFSVVDKADNSGMNNALSTSSAEEMSAAVINTAIYQADTEGGVSYRELAANVENTAQGAGVETAQVAEYIGALRTFTHDVTIGALPEGVGGQFDGSITIALDTVKVGPKGVEETIAKMQEVFDHEAYHALNHHTDAMMTWDGAPTVIIAGEGFTTTEIVEGLTVAETGEDFVSGKYKDHKRYLLSSIVQADLPLEDVKDAVNNTKDLKEIDDRGRAFEPTMAEYLNDAGINGDALVKASQTPEGFQRLQGAIVMATTRKRLKEAGVTSAALAA